MALRSRWVARLVAALAVSSVAGWGSASATGAEAPRAAGWIDGDAAVYLEILRPADVFDRMAEKRYETLLGAVPGYRKFLDGDDYKQLRAVVDVVSQGVGTTAEPGVRDLTSGGVVLAIEGPGQPAHTILFVTPGDAKLLDRAHAKLLELARTDAENKGNPDPVKQHDYRGVTVYSLNEHEAHAIIAGTLVITNGEAIKRVIDRSLDAGALKPPIADNASWKARRAALEPGAVAWSFFTVDRLRAMDPSKFNVPDEPNPVGVLLFNSWLEVLRKAPWASQSLTLTADRMNLELTVPTPPAGYSDALKRYAPIAGKGAPAPIRPPGTIASFGLWRDLSALWEVRADLFPAETVQGLAKLDGVAGQFFGGRDFGSGILASLGTDWQLVIARQDYQLMNPVPDQKLPAFALVANLKDNDDDFATRLQSAFQSFVGIANIEAAQKKTKAPPLMLGSETYEGVTISTSRFMVPKDSLPKGEPVHQRHNFSPSTALVGNKFILSSSVGLTRDLVKTLKQPTKPTDTTLIVEADGLQFAQWLEINRTRSVMQNMVEKGNDKAAAEREVGQLIDLVRSLGHGTLTAKDGADAVQLRLNFALDAK